MEFMACMGRILDLAFCICTHCLYITLIWEAKIYSQHWVILEQEKTSCPSASVVISTAVPVAEAKPTRG